MNAKKDEHSVLKKSLSFIFFDDEHLSQAEKDLEFQNLLRNENFHDENLDYENNYETEKQLPASISIWWRFGNK